jgi:GT2 family glycosyltransferase
VQKRYLRAAAASKYGVNTEPLTDSGEERNSSIPRPDKSAFPTRYPDLSVIVLNWNTRNLLAQCLRSLQLQESGLSQLEVIVVDNGSTDGSLGLVRTSFPHVRVIANSANRGFSEANNQGIQAATGRYVLLLNSDTVVMEGALGALVTYADNHPGVGVVGPKLLNPDGTLQPSGGRLPTPASITLELLLLDRLRERPRYGTRRDYSHPADVDEVSGAAMLIRHEVIRQIGGLDEKFTFGYEDVDFCLRARHAGWRIHYVPEARIVHEWGASRRAAQASTTLSAIAGQRYYFRKHYGRVSSALVFVVTVLSHILRLGAFGIGGVRNAALRQRARIELSVLCGLVGQKR